MKHRRLPVPSGKHRKAMEQRKNCWPAIHPARHLVADSRHLFALGEAEEAGLTPTQRIANRVAPYRNKPYEEQLANKSKWLVWIERGNSVCLILSDDGWRTGFQNGILNELRRNMAE